jgi:hypothetical protein
MSNPWLLLLSSSFGHIAAHKVLIMWSKVSQSDPIVVLLGFVWFTKLYILKKENHRKAPGKKLLYYLGRLENFLPIFWFAFREVGFQGIEPTLRLHHLPSVNFETWNCKQVTPFWWVPRSLKCGPWLFSFNSWYRKLGEFFAKIYSNFHKKNTKISQIFGPKNDQICREKVTSVNKERWVGKEIQNCRLQNNALSCEFAKPFLDKGKSHKCMVGKKVCIYGYMNMHIKEGNKTTFSQGFSHSDNCVTIQTSVWKRSGAISGFCYLLVFSRNLSVDFVMRIKGTCEKFMQFFS